MKIAIIHDCLVEFGGAERVLLSLLELYPSATVYTSMMDVKFQKEFMSGYKVQTMKIPQKFFTRHTSLFQSISPLLWKTMTINADIIISIAGHLMCNLINPKKSVFIQYLLSPPKNIYSLSEKSKLQQIIPYDTYIRQIYRNALLSTNHLITISNHMRSVYETTMQVSPSVIYPPVHIPTKIGKKGEGKYFLIISRIDRSKSIEIAIKSCNYLNEKLLIVGETNEPSYFQYLQRISGSTIQFMGFRHDDEIQKLYEEAKGFIFTPKNEDFGIAPIEAMAHGVPVIAYKGGGVRETLIPGKTGEFFTAHSSPSLIKTLTKFDTSKYAQDELYTESKKYSEDVFKENFSSYVQKCVR